LRAGDSLPSARKFHGGLATPPTVFSSVALRALPKSARFFLCFGTARGRADVGRTRHLICVSVRCRPRTSAPDNAGPSRGGSMNKIIYIVGLVVIVIAILSFVGLR